MVLVVRTGFIFSLRSEMGLCRQDCFAFWQSGLMGDTGFIFSLRSKMGLWGSFTIQTEKLLRRRLSFLIHCLDASITNGLKKEKHPFGCFFCLLSSGNRIALPFGKAASRGSFTKKA